MRNTIPDLSRMSLEDLEGLKQTKQAEYNRLIDQAVETTITAEYAALLPWFSFPSHGIFAQNVAGKRLDCLNQMKQINDEIARKTLKANPPQSTA